MNTKDISFKVMEKRIYDYVCEFARAITNTIMKKIDERIMEERDSNRYRLKDSIKTSIKTLFGEVEYKRRYYYDKNTDSYTFLLDEMLEIKKNGLFSANMAELIVNECINESYRKAAADISNATAQTVSSVGAWRLVQEVGRNIAAKEEQNLIDMKNGIRLSPKTVSVLFQEADGVWLNMQKNKKKVPKQELKLATVYEGWRDTNRHELVGKRVMAGMMTGKKFMKIREAFVRSIYDLDNIKIKLLNGDGALWIDSEGDELTYKQLDQYHLHKEITRCIQNKKIRKLIIRRLHEHDIDKMLECIMMYADSVDNNDRKDKRADDARELYAYLSNNRAGLLKYKEVIDVPEPEFGIVYRNMGVQESQNCSLVTRRMKHGRMRWSESGADNLAKVICSKSNGDLDKFVAKVYDGIVPLRMIEAEDDEDKILSATKMPFTSGKGDAYADLINASIPILSDRSSTAAAIRDIIESYSI